MDEILLNDLKRVLPKKFDDVYFIEEVELIAQQIRRMELKQESSDPRRKLIRPDLQKKLVKGTLRNKAYRLLETLRELPDDCAMRIDRQCMVKEAEQNEKYNIDSRVGFTKAALEVTKQLVDYCDQAYEHNNQGWRNPYKTQEAFIAHAYEKSRGTISVSVNGNFSRVLQAFRAYCQVKDYDPSTVNASHISRVMNELS
jgi:hypothetical protein